MSGLDYEVDANNTVFYRKEVSSMPDIVIGNVTSQDGNQFIIKYSDELNGCCNDVVDHENIVAIYDDKEDHKNLISLSLTSLSIGGTKYLTGYFIKLDLSDRLTFIQVGETNNVL